MEGAPGGIGWWHFMKSYNKISKLIPMTLISMTLLDMYMG